MGGCKNVGVATLGAGCALGWTWRSAFLASRRFCRADTCGEAMRGMGVAIGAAVGASALGRGWCRGVALAWVKISANCLSARTWASPMGANGVLGCGFRRAAVRSLAASVAASADEVVGMAKSLGKNSTVREMRSLRVEGTYTLWHR